jgi:uncharacterized protein (DUF58 family)
MNAALRSFLGQGEKAALRYALGVPRHAPVGLAGGTLSRSAGSSLEFKDHRAYEPGDDLRHIDWSAYARSDQLTIKLFREEVTPVLDFVMDTSRSMALEGTDKAGAATALAAFFVTAAARAGYVHTVWTMGERVTAMPGGNRPPGLWEGLAFDHRGEPAQTLPPFRCGGTRVLVSDLLWPADPLRLLRPFAERAAVAVVVQLLARIDCEPPEGQSLRLVDAETDEVREIHVDAVEARRYCEALERHQDNWEQACRQTGVTFVSVVAEDLLRDWDLDALVASEILRVM